MSEEELREALGDLGFGGAAVTAAQEMVGEVASNSDGVTLHDFLHFIRRVRDQSFSTIVKLQTIATIN